MTSGYCGRSDPLAGLKIIRYFCTVWKIERGPKKSLLHFKPLMKKPEEEKIAAYAEPKIAELGGFLVEVRVNPNKVLVEFDKPGGITINECTLLSRYLHQVPELEEIFTRHELEVSSPGVGKPLRVMGQFRKNIGRELKVKTKEGETHIGILKEVNDQGLTLQKPPAKKKEAPLELTLSFDQITESIVQTIFK